MIRRPPRSTQSRSSAASDVYKRQLLVVRGADRTPDEIRQVVEVSTPELRASHAQLIAVIANRCVPSQLDAVREALAGEVPVWAIPDEPFLQAPTVQGLMA